MHSRFSLSFVLGLSLLLGAACGDDDGGGSGNGDGGPLPGQDGGGPAIDAGGRTYGDATPGGECEAMEAQCNNCMDDDGDGDIDGADIHCTGPLDNDEGSFATGIPGDNMDPKKQDCFFDGNSGQCQIHTCCLFPEGQCDEEVYGNYNPNTDCDNVTAPCIAECLPLVPPGCDCFGCCTICNPDTDVCADILANAAVSPDCDKEDIGNPDTMDECVSCVKFDECNGEECNMDPEDCVLCFGEDENDLPDSCGGTNECPGSVPCEPANDMCPEGEYCSNSCCVSVVE